MSTFNGRVLEFPEIRVDYFRPVEGIRPPLACFLSHVHSDHLVGLESLKSPFIYCSAATKELLLRLEKYPHRINFQLGILESRKQHFKHLKSLLKPIPLETPTIIELEPGNEIQVTLFDANHCTGAVMFLFEGHGYAVLYTGDIRAEPWFVNNLRRNPLLIEYTSQLKTLDCIYLDTSFTDDLAFPTKAEGLKELLQKVAEYPSDTKFHFTAWTFGYEEVWMALSKALKSQIHVDSYKMRLYKALRGEATDKEHSGAFFSHEGPILTGYKCANSQQAGCLTLDQSVRLHSCEKGTPCTGIDDKTVWIRPIITRTASGVEIGEVGVGGGVGDLKQSPELELGTDAVVKQLMTIFREAGSSTLDSIRKVLLDGLHSARRVLSLDGLGLDREADELALEDLGKMLATSIRHDGEHPQLPEARDELKSDDQTVHHRASLPKVITFPYSRHSSYPELCHLVEVFKPRDIYPCTVDEANWHLGVGIKSLFGHLSSGYIFRHDLEMMKKRVADIEEDDEAPGRSTSASETSSEGGQSSVEIELDNAPNQSGIGSIVERSNKRQRTDKASTDHIAAFSANFLQEQDTEPLENPDWVSYFDRKDGVYRCKACGWEVWTPTGECSGCGSGYYCYSVALHTRTTDAEEQPDGSKKRKRLVEQYPEFVGLSSEFESAGIPVEELVEKYLDNQSAYSSVVDDEESEYEINSFIDDESVSELSEEKNDMPPNYQVLYENLQRAYEDLATKHENLASHHQGLRQDSYSCVSKSNSSDLETEDDSTVGSGSLSADSPVTLMEDNQPGTPPCQKFIGLPTDKESQESLTSHFSTAAPWDDYDAGMETASEDEPNISLISAGDNHSTVEVEL